MELPGRAAHQEFCAGQQDDPRAPAAAERRDTPQPAKLQRDKDRKERPGRGGIGRHQQKQADKPGAMHHDEPGIPARVDLDRALRPQTACVRRRKGQLGAALQDDEAENRVEDAHPRLSTAKPAVNPGPSAVTSARSHRLSSARSSTNSTLAADMLPYSRSTARASLNTPGLSSKASSRASITFGPPGWQTKRSRSPSASPCRPRKSRAAGPILAATSRGMSREKTGFSPSSATSQPMMSRVCGQVCSPLATTDGPAPPHRSTAAAAPSPNSAAATILLFPLSPRRKVKEHNSTTRSSTALSGIAAASVAARASPMTP